MLYMGVSVGTGTESGLKCRCGQSAVAFRLRVAATLVNTSSCLCLASRWLLASFSPNSSTANCPDITILPQNVNRIVDIYIQSGHVKVLG